MPYYKKEKNKKEKEINKQIVYLSKNRVFIPKETVKPPMSASPRGILFLKTSIID